MGFKNVCLNCKRAVNLGTDFENFRNSHCPECSNEMYFVNHKFKPPKKNDSKNWKLVEFLIQNGFRFDSIYDEKYRLVSYPVNMREAKLFIKKYGEQEKSK